MFWLHLNDHWWFFFLTFVDFILKEAITFVWKKMRCRFVLIPNFLGAELSFSTVPNCLFQRCRTVFFNGCRNVLVPNCLVSRIFSNFGWPDYLFYLQKLPDPPPPFPPRNQLVVPKTNQEIDEPCYEMVGVKIMVTNYGQNKSYFWHFFSGWFFYFLLRQLQMFSS